MIKQLIGFGAVAVLAVGCASGGKSVDNSLPTPAGGETAVYGEQNVDLPDRQAVGSGKNYTVMSGDSLWKIARINGTTVEKLKAANNLSGELIHPGQVLVIP